MKQGIHPEYREILFVDSSTSVKFLCGTTLQPKGSQTEVFEGKEYPVQLVDVTSSSHPFFTKEGGRFLDSEGRVEKFFNRYAKATEKVAATAQQAAQPPPQPEKKRPKARPKLKEQPS